jgi:hypothetical protein
LPLFDDIICETGHSLLHNDILSVSLVVVFTTGKSIRIELEQFTIIFLEVLVELWILLCEFRQL